MSKRSPFWRPFSARTPLGYAIAGFFNTEPSHHYGSIRVTHVDGPLPRPYVLPGIPEVVRAQPGPAGIALRMAPVDLRAVERSDGTPVGFYPLFDGDGALVEVLARTRDTVVVQDTPWRPLATLTARARHAGIEEAVRRQRGIFVFQLVGSANPRLVRYPFELKFVLQQVVRGTGRVLAPYSQVRGWANQYGLDLPATLAQFDPHLDAAALAREATALEQGRLAPGAEPGTLSSAGMVIWASERAGATLLDLSAGQDGAAPVTPVDVWDAMARLADRSEAPTREAVSETLVRYMPQAERAAPGAIAEAWERWARMYPEALASATVPVAV